MAGGLDGARRKPGFLTFPIWLPHVTGADTYEIRHCPYIDVNVVPDSQRRQKMNPHLTSIYISSYRYSAHVRKANPYNMTPLELADAGQCWRRSQKFGAWFGARALTIRAACGSWPSAPALSPLAPPSVSQGRRRLTTSLPMRVACYRRPAHCCSSMLTGARDRWDRGLARRRSWCCCCHRHPCWSCTSAPWSDQQRDPAEADRHRSAWIRNPTDAASATLRAAPLCPPLPRRPNSTCSAACRHSRRPRIF